MKWGSVCILHLVNGNQASCERVSVYCNAIHNHNNNNNLCTKVPQSHFSPTRSGCCARKRCMAKKRREAAIALVLGEGGCRFLFVLVKYLLMETNLINANKLFLVKANKARQKVEAFRLSSGGAMLRARDRWMCKYLPHNNAICEAHSRAQSRCKNAHEMHIFGESWAFRHVHWALETFIILVASTKASIGEDGNSSFFRTHGHRNAFRLTLVQTGECLVVPRSVCWSNLFDSRRARLQTWAL